MDINSHVSIVITPEQKAAILGAIANLNQQMSFLIGLTDEQRRKMLKMGDKTVGFDEKCASYMASRPDLIPGFVDMAALGNDRQSRSDVGDIMRALGEVVQRLDDSEMVLSHQIYVPDLSFYQNVALAAKRNVPGAQAVYNDLRIRFPGHPHTAAASIDKPASATVSA